MSGVIQFLSGMLGTGAHPRPVSPSEPLPVYIAGAAAAGVALAGTTAIVSFPRSNDTSAYTGGDVEGTSTGATASQEFTLIGPAGKEVIITSVALEHDITAVPAGMTSYRLHLYNIAPPSALADNVAWDLPAGDRPSYLGYVDLGTPQDVGSTLYVEANGVNKQVTLLGTSLFGYLVTNGGYTPAASTVRKITIHAIPV